MKNIKYTPYLTLGILFILFNICAFAIPSEKTVAFFTAYAFSVVAFLAQIPLWLFLKGRDRKSFLFGTPPLFIGSIYLLVQTVAFLVFMIFPTLPVWSAVVASSAILALFVICAVLAMAGAGEISRIDKKVKVKVAFIQLLITDIEMLAERECDKETKGALISLAEEVRFSDPMSDEMLCELEARINGKVEEMKVAEDKRPLIKEISLLLTERNKKCKILK
ncbi:MAG: hypothetical protein J6L90_00595 [Clostridia bacterium]|nr:hypothetical protein [Clostridia bacterium]